MNQSGTGFGRSSSVARTRCISKADSRPLDRYFPELHDALLKRLPKNCVVDGEIVIATARGLDFDALQLRLHPAASRTEKLAKETPSSFVAFDLLALKGRTLMAAPQAAPFGSRAVASEGKTARVSHTGHARSSGCARLANAL
jgi:hypothetical protein